MKNRTRSNSARKVITLLMILALSASALFALPLQKLGDAGDSKTYNSAYKAVEPIDISEGWVIRTFNSGLCLSNDEVRFDIGPNSLVKVMSLEQEIQLYLLDGVVSAESDVRSFTIKTPATSYSAQPNTILVVLSDSTNELGYVKDGSVKAENIITDEKTDITSGTYIDNAQKGFVPQQTDGEVFSAKLPSQPIVEEVTVTVEPEDTSVIEVASEVLVEAEKHNAMQYIFTFQGFTAKIEAYIGKAYIYYPTYVTEKDIDQAALAAYNAYPSLLEGIYYQTLEPGLTEITYPEIYGPNEFNYAIELLNKDLPYYLASLTVETESVEDTMAEEIATTEIVVATPGALHADFNYYGISASVDAYIGTGYVTYPSYITDAEIFMAASAAVNAYPTLLKDIHFKILQPGKVELTYPESYGPVEFAYAVELLNKELPLYLASVLNVKEETPEAVEEVVVASLEVVETVEATVEETNAEEQSTKVTAITVSPKENVKVVQSENALKLGAEISASYGINDGIYNPIERVFKNRVGLYQEGARITVAPYIYTDNFAFGINLTINPFDVANSLEFNFNGKKNIVNSLASYISQFKFEKGAFAIKAERNSALQFTSPYTTSIDNSFVNANKLLGTITYSGKSFNFYAFIDDMQLNNMLANKDQFIGARASYKYKNLTLGASAALNVGQGLRSSKLYPAIDAQYDFNIKNTAFALTLGFAGEFSANNIKSLNAYMAEAKISATKGILNGAIGASFNGKKHINGVMNNGLTTIIRSYEGNTIDILLNAGLETKVFNIKAEAEVPFTINGPSRLAYNTVRTDNSSTRSISADNFTIKGELMLGKFTFEAGASIDGLCGNLANAAKAMLKKAGRRSALGQLIDPQISSYFAQANFSTEYLSIYTRADFDRIDGRLTIPVSMGLSIKF